jgi:hypothetical protein
VRALLVTLALVTAGALSAAPVALADDGVSSNWAGYAAHGTSFHSVWASWRQPGVSCARGQSAYSAYWVGLGGYSAGSNALEQIGTEADCQGGHPVLSAWYEMVPAGSVTVYLPVTAGDSMTAAVTVSGHRATLVLANATRHRTFRTTVSSGPIDISSAEWIVEAPSECTGDGQCFALPLADFGEASLFAAHATTTAGRAGAITSSWWNSTEITLVPHSSRLFADMAEPQGEAIPSALTAGGSAFTVSYQPISQPGGGSGPPGPFFTTRASQAAAGQLIHPMR